ncbi:hypothetical protein M9Y10_020917 [Tritrichomonas musculus]|uniref:Protein kinase domain-containing protein n=1 Tax=Tritrichomonas musculus TaxID=1915356 RepID=A0ABR2HG37_9EUKA
MNINNPFYDPKDFQFSNQILRKGLFGPMCITKNIKDGNLYSIKIINVQEEFNEAKQIQFIRESVIIRKLNNPGNAKIFGINFQSLSNPTKLEPSIITEYFQKGTLNEIISDPSFIFDSTKKYIALLGIANAMQYLHQNRIIHYNLNPYNILFDEYYYPHVRGFDLAYCFPSTFYRHIKLAIKGQITSPLLYLAPEILKEEYHRGNSADVYSFGILAYQIVTGKIPYFELGQELSAAELSQKILNGYRPQFTGDVTDSMKSLISCCWSDKIEERPSFFEIFVKLSTDFSLIKDVNESDVKLFIEKVKNNDYYYIFSGDKKSSESTEDIYLKEASLYLKAMSEKGDGFASYLLGLLFQKGQLFERDLNKAFYYFQKSSEQKNSYGLQKLASCYYYGYGIEQSYSKAVEYLLQSAALENSNALYSLGICYYNGHGVEQSYSKAFEYFQKAADLGSSYGLINIGLCYDNGEGVEQDYSKAIEFYEKSAELGNSDALFNLAVRYYNGQGVEQDYQKAVDLYSKSADLGNSEGLFGLGFCYYMGQGVEQDFSNAFKLYKKAAELGSNDALYSLGLCYFNGHGVVQNFSKAIECFQKVESENSMALFCLGFCYENGEGVERDFLRATKYYQKSVNIGNSYAMCSLAFCYQNGYGVEQCYSKAIELYRKAASLDNSEGLFRLAMCYENGLGIDKCYEDAIELYRKAAELGCDEAENRLSVIEENS